MKIGALPNASGGDDLIYFIMGDIVERAHIFFLKPLAQIFRGNKARFAVGQVPPGFFPKFDKRRVRKSHDVPFTIYVELCIDGVAMARGDGIPDMRKAAIVNMPTELRGDIKRANELAHGAVVR
jgi:hypothetical protein